MTNAVAVHSNAAFSSITQEKAWQTKIPVPIAVGLGTYISIAVPVGLLVGYVLQTANAGHLLGLASFVVMFSSFVLACLVGRLQYRWTNRRENGTSALRGSL